MTREELAAKLAADIFCNHIQIERAGLAAGYADARKKYRIRAFSLGAMLVSLAFENAKVRGEVEFKNEMAAVLNVLLRDVAPTLTAVPSRDEIVAYIEQQGGTRTMQEAYRMARRREKLGKPGASTEA